MSPPDVDVPPGAPNPPEPEALPPGWPHQKLHEAVRDTIYALPSFFDSDLHISGVLATDLHTFNTSLGATIESQVVDALNSLRSSWDPDEEYTGYTFVRQPQTFPDVTLRAVAPETRPPVLMGIELKGWFVLAKEHEPSFRFKVTPAVCAPQDLLVVYPWALSNVVAGSPQLFKPYVEQARYAAAYRNWFWEFGKKGKGGDTGITLSTVTEPYPTKSDEISDVPKKDGGGNFGRIARVRIMDDYMTELFTRDLLGVPLEYWNRFLALFVEDRAEDVIARRLERIADQVAKQKKAPSPDQVEEIRDHFAEVAKILGGD